eukprot:jgi/Chrpa1/19394/Chrysochromulina_OHIO_Genome00003171-RA
MSAGLSAAERAARMPVSVSSSDVATACLIRFSSACSAAVSSPHACQSATMRARIAAAERPIATSRATKAALV